jgi:predicted metal-dependent peptidase
MQTLPAIIAKARARLLVRAPFLGSIALGLLWIETTEIATMATDGRSVWFNTPWCIEHGVEKTMGVIAHEVLHVVNKHHLRRGDRDPKLWNIAADLLINRLLLDDDYHLPSDGVFDRERRFAGLATETIYERLREAIQEAGGGGHGEEAPPADGSNGHDSEQTAAPAPSWGEVRDLTAENGRALTAAERRQADHDLDMRLRQAAAAAKRVGKLSQGYREIVEASSDRVDWRDRFRTTFDGILRSESSWSRPNRRFIQRGLYLPGWSRAGAGRIAFVLDTSGSISARELAVYTGNVLGLLEETGPEVIALIQCDTDVKQVDYIHAGDGFDRIEVVGRGGTLFQPAFDWIADNAFDPRAIIYATDLGSADQPHDPGVPVIWLTPTRGRTMPFGTVIEVSI